LASLFHHAWNACIDLPDIPTSAVLPSVEFPQPGSPRIPANGSLASWMDHFGISSGTCNKNAKPIVDGFASMVAMICFLRAKKMALVLHQSSDNFFPGNFLFSEL
jgi:hypothetical protein